MIELNQDLPTICSEGAAVACVADIIEPPRISSATPQLSVLVVEDDSGDFALVDRALRRMTGYEVQITLAGSLESARFALSVASFDLVVLDYNLREGRGTELLCDIGGSPTILLSSLVTSEIDHEALGLGALACLSKDDITPRVMENVVRLALRGSGKPVELAGTRFTHAGIGSGTVQ